MKIIAGDRGSGKTKALIDESARSGCYIVVNNHESAYAVARMASQNGQKIPFPLTYSEILHGRQRGVKGFLIDNAEMLLRRLAQGVPVEAITLGEPNTILLPKSREALQQRLDANRDEYSRLYSQLVELAITEDANESEMHIKGCQSDHDLCLGELWLCPECKKIFCTGAGLEDDNHELCDDCWAQKVNL